MRLMIAFAVAAAASAEPIKCGVATGTFALNTPTLTTAVKTGKLSFWWNWNTAPNLDTTGLSNATAAAMSQAFVPMLWGTAMPSDYAFLKDAEGDVMGFNEPDLYGPACCNCKGKQSYYPATSSGWLPLFNPKSAAQHWRQTVNNLTTGQRPGTTERRIISPAMANGALPTPGIDCTLDPAAAPNPKRCEGWLSMFRDAALALQCTRFDGRSTNCWDVIVSPRGPKPCPEPRIFESLIFEPRQYVLLFEPLLLTGGPMIEPMRAAGRASDPRLRKVCPRRPLQGRWLPGALCRRLPGGGRPLEKDALAHRGRRLCLTLARRLPCCNSLLHACVGLT